MKKQKLTAKQIADYIPETLDDIAGNYELVEYLRERMSYPPEEDPSLMIIGDPGTGKTSAAIAYLRQRLKDPQLGYSNDSGHFATLAGKQYGFVRINGASVTRNRLQQLAGDATESSAIHTFVLLDEAGELFFQGLEDVLRDMLEHPEVTTYATAQDFHTKKRPTDTAKEHDNRLASFLRKELKSICEARDWDTSDWPKRNHFHAYLEERSELLRQVNIKLGFERVAEQRKVVLEYIDRNEIPPWRAPVTR